MGLSGSWRNRAMGLTDIGGGPNSLGAADPQRHMTPYTRGAHGADDTAATRSAVQTPFSLDPPSPEWYDSTDYYAGGISPGPQTDPVNQEPWPTHTVSGDTFVPSGQTSTGHGDDDYQWSDDNATRDQVLPTPVHQRDRGAARWAKFHRPIMEAGDEKHTTPRFTPNENTSNSDPKREREAWSKPVNNPPDTVQRTAGDPHRAESGRVGWASQTRYGYRVQRWNTRKIPHGNPYWENSQRGYALKTARTATESPPVQVGNQYTSPFAMLANTRFGNFLHPMLRREPQAWDESAVSDGTESSTVLAESVAQYQSWGL
jgi:hypothetical protein